MSLPGARKDATLRARTIVDASGKVMYSDTAVPVRARVQAARVRVETGEGDSEWVDGATAYLDGLPSVSVGDRFDHGGAAYTVVGEQKFSDPDLPRYTQLWLDAMARGKQ